MDIATAGLDREFLLVVNALERLAARVVSELDAESVEGCRPDGPTSLLSYADSCLRILDDPAVAARLTFTP